MSRIQAKLAGLLCAVTLALAAPAQAQVAGDSSEELQAEYDRLFQETLQNPTDLDTLFAFAGVAIRQGNYESAISALERMLLLNPNLPRVKLELGVLYYRLGSYEAAKRYFEDAIDDQNVPPVVETRVREYLARIDEDTADSIWFGRVTVAGRYQTNANAGPANAVVRAGGQDAVLDDTFLEEDDFSFFGLATVRNSTRFGLGAGAADYGFDDQASWLTDVPAYYSAQVEFSDLNVGLIALNSGPQFEVLGDSTETGGFLIRPYVLTDFASLGQEPFYWSVGAGITATTAITAQTSLRIAYQYRYRQFNNTEENPDVEELTGGENFIGGDLLTRITDGVTGRFGASIAFDEGEVSYQDNTEMAIYAAVDLIYPSPFEITPRPWETTLSAAGVFTGYDAADPSVDPNVIRRDQELRLLMSNLVPLNQSLAVLGQVEYFNNYSNLPNYKFDNLTGVLGMTMKF